LRVPLARALSKLGIMSRTEAVHRILSGDVRVAGRVVRDPGFLVVPERAQIVIGDHAAERQPSLTILMNKPRGVVTTRRDPDGRRTVYDVLGSAAASGARLPYLSPIGRLDMASTGLLLLTNDTRLSDRLLDPANAITRTYIVTVRGSLTDDEVAGARRGVSERGELLKAHRLDVLKRSGRETHVRVELAEGRTRELRRLFAALGHEVTRLKRIAFGGLELGTLAPGAWRVVEPDELIAAFPSIAGRGP
jgi:23S rRNA pseudouridine2605 synthase